jgi:ABC-type multidrug transport system permease subunit
LVTTLAVMTAIFGHSWGGLVPLAVLIALVVFAFAGIGALIGALPRTSNQAVLLAIAVPFAFALASGTFSPPDAPVRPSGAWFAPPTHALDAFAEIAVTHAGLGAIAGELVFLVAAGVLGGLASLIVELRR